ncbi:helix-turn-helix transcriptional regulator [Chryseobacterium sp. A321]
MFRILLLFLLAGTPLFSQSLHILNQVSYSTKDLERLIKEKKATPCEDQKNKTYYKNLADSNQPHLQVLSLLFRADDFSQCYDRINSQSEVLFHEAIGKSQNISDELWIYSQLEYANYLYRYRNMSKALMYYLTIDRTIKKGELKDPIRYRYTLRSLGYFYGTIGASREELHYLNEALMLSSNDWKERAAVLDALGNYYLNSGELGKAESFFEDAKRVALKSKQEIRYAKVLGNLARVEMKRQNFPRAMNLLEEDIAISIRFKESMNLMFARTILAQLYFELGDLEKAEQNLELATLVYKSKPYYATNGLDIEKLKLRVYEEIGQEDKQLKTYKVISQLEKFVETLDGDKALDNTHLLLQKLNLQSAISESEQKKVLLKRTIFFYSVIIALMSLLAMYIVKYQRNKVKNERLVYDDKVKSLELINLQTETELFKANQNLTLHGRYLKNKNIHVINLRRELQNEHNSKNELLVDRQKKIDSLLSTHLMTHENWEMFKQEFMIVHKGFYKDIETDFPDLTESNKRFVFLRKLGLSSREISQLLGVTQEAVKKSAQRLKKKLGERYALLEKLIKEN